MYSSFSTPESQKRMPESISCLLTKLNRFPVIKGETLGPRLLWSNMHVPTFLTAVRGKKKG